MRLNLYVFRDKSFLSVEATSRSLIIYSFDQPSSDADWTFAAVIFYGQMDLVEAGVLCGFLGEEIHLDESTSPVIAIATASSAQDLATHFALLHPDFEVAIVVHDKLSTAQPASRIDELLLSVNCPEIDVSLMSSNS